MLTEIARDYRQGQVIPTVDYTPDEVRPPYSMFHFHDNILD